MDIQEFSFPTRILFGAGAISRTAAELKNAGKKRPLLVADRHVARLPFVRSLEADLKSAGLDISEFHEFSGNPVESHVMYGAAAFKNHRADSLVIIGGGATLDTGKAIALMAGHPGKLFDYREDGPGRFDQPIPWMVAIPTTAGTGSEVGRSSVISRDDTREKVVIFSPVMLPPLVIADPGLTTGLPPGVTATTGFDALSHSLEAWLSRGWHPSCDGIALEASRLVLENITRACEQPDDIEARGHMLMASLMGAIAFQKGLGVIHSCAHALSTVFDLHHGTAIALMTPAGITYNAMDTETGKRIRRLANYAGLPEGTSLAGHIKNLRQRLLPDLSLRDCGVRITADLIGAAMADGCHGLNPRPIDEGSLRTIFDEAYRNG